MTHRRIAYWACLFVAAFATLAQQRGVADDESKDQVRRRTIQAALEPLNDWVGVWRGVGQPKRNSNKGAWTEEAEWTWKLERTNAGLQLEIKDGKQIQSGYLTYDPADKRFHLTVKVPGGESRQYAGDRAGDGKLALITKDEATEEETRLTFQMRHDDRMLLLIETKPGGQPAFARVAEVGYTRKGGSFAAAADAGPKCIVTDGRGSIAVEYKGKTYYVCCSGCKTALLEDPERIIAEAAERAKKSRAK